MSDFININNRLSPVLINDYVEDVLEPLKKNKIKELISKNPELSTFVERSIEGKKQLKKTYAVKAAADFEDKLAHRIELGRIAPTP